ncbi:MAG TPA: twin-arginine translocase subunit TatC [Candidatus Limnocylindrales bacterium]|nr:twin-arginine translocase subunit TatC [Candidatus Limnocylindrales bacterium]
MTDADALAGAGHSERAGDGIPPVSSGTPEPPPAVVGEEKVMSLVDHLSELRSRVARVILAVVAGSVVGWLVATEVRNILIRPIGSAQVLAPGDAFVIQLKISLLVGIILAMPVILYQVWVFVAPGLTRSERRILGPLILLALLFFALGVGLAYVVLPYAIGFLLQFTDDVLVQGLAAGPYFDFVTTMFLAFGLIMEFPIVLFALSRVGIVTSARLAASRRMAILGIAIFAAAATPGGDLVSPLALGLTMYALFEGTLLVIRRTGR